MSKAMSSSQLQRSFVDDDKRNGRGRERTYSTSRSRSRSRSHSKRYASRRHSRSRSRSRSRNRRYRRRSSRSRSRSGSRNYASMSRRRFDSRSPSCNRNYNSRRRSRSNSHSRSRSRSNSSRTISTHQEKRVDANGDWGRRQSYKPDGLNASAATTSANHTSAGPAASTARLDNKKSNSSSTSTFYELNDDEEPFDKERIHREMEEKLREALAREGKVYPPKKPEASHPVFANDGSFLEIFKKLQEQQAAPSVLAATAALPIVNPIIAPQAISVTNTTAAYVAATATGRSAPPPPVVGRRRGGKILKTGMVAKQKLNTDSANADPKDFWSLYLAEVNKYKNSACETDSGTRPLVK